MKKTYFLEPLIGRKAIALVSLLGLSVLGAQVQGQALNYSPATATNTTSTFTALGATATTITVDDLDDANSEPQPIGFTFNYNGQNFTQFVLNTNGVLKLGGTALSGSFNDFLTSEDPADRNLLLPFGTDLVGTASSFKVATTGSGTTRVCTIEWGNMSPFAFGAPQFTGFTFQVKLYETTNVVEFVYGPSTPGTITIPSSATGVGLKGSGRGPSQVVLATKAATQAWSAATFLNTYYPNPTTQRFDYDRTTLADAGRTYRFVPATCLPPSAVTFTGTTTSSTVLNFTAPSNGTGYTIVYGAPGFNPATGTPQTVAASPYTITGLTVGTSYDLYIRSNCGATDQSVFAGPFTFRTTCATTAPVVAFPYTENFDATASGTLPCTITTLDVNGDSNPWINRSTVRTLAGQTPVSASNPNAMVYFYNEDGTTAANDWFFTPPLLLTTGFRYQLTFKYRSSGNTSFPERLEVKYGNAATVAGQTNTLWNNAAIVAPTYVTAGAASTPPVATITPTT
ncbi:MAG TPA: choice-of-anchor J domain-containing protein, partial [Hymenobacter sp.]|nr:choice-of-anchor J domain-containing protein [Hymenobacter sp.]